MEPDWDDFFRQSGYGFVGEPYQRGGFLGGLLRGLARVALPTLKGIGKAVGRQALRTGMEVAGDILQGDDIGQSIEERGKAGMGRLLTKGAKKLGAKKRKNGKRRKRRQAGGMGGLGTFRNIRKRSNGRAPAKKRKTNNRKRGRADIFGF